jgi:heptosyltransferase-2
MPRGPALVVRFSSLGDVLLAAQMPSFLREAEPGRRVLFLTKERYAPILRGHPGVERFYMLADGSLDPAAPAPLGVRGGLGDLLAFLRREEIGEVVDLHQNLRSSRVVSTLDRARRTIAPKHSLRRRLWVHARWLRPPRVPPLLRTYRSLAGVDTAGPLHPWLRDALTPEERERAQRSLGADADGLAVMGVSARWETKRWPLKHFVALADRVEREHGLIPRFVLAPEDSALRAELERLLPGERHHRIAALPFRETAAIAAHARVIVSNDSAVLHLGPSLDVPAVGVFGSTVPAFGFAPQGPCDTVVENELSCRPCSVHGRRRCPLGHHACMRDLRPETVLAGVRAALIRRARPGAERRVASGESRP